MLDLAVARIENVAVLIFQAVALHVADEGNSEHRRVLAVVGAFRADRRIGSSPGSGNVLAITPSKMPSWSTTSTPDHGLAVLDLLPQSRGRRLAPTVRRLRRDAHGNAESSAIENTCHRSAASVAIWIARSASSSPDQSQNRMAPDYGHFADAFQCRDRGCRQGAFKQAAITSHAAAIGHNSRSDQLTPSFFCRLEDDVVYWNTSRLSG